MMASTEVSQAETVLLRWCPEAEPLLSEMERELDALPDAETDRLLDLPISIYGGG